VSLTLVLPAVIVYKRSHKRSGALWGMALGSALMSLLGGPLMNYYVLIPLYQTFMPMDQIIAMAKIANPSIDGIWTLILYAIVPFNLFKSVSICVITYLLYKPLSPVLHKYR
jgi:riboflavin transporter FmnP